MSTSTPGIRRPSPGDRKAANAKPPVRSMRYWCRAMAEGGRGADQVYEVIDATAPLRQAPSPDAPLDTEALNGERVIVAETREGWARAKLAADGYGGYLPATALAPAGPPATRKAAALRRPALPEP